MLNVIILTGRLTKEPLLMKGVNGTSIVDFDIAVDNRMKNPDGSRGTTFLTCKAFQKLAENILASRLHKGSKVAVSGIIQQRNYLTKDGSKRSVYEVICDSVEFLDPKPVEEEPDVEKLPEDAIVQSFDPEDKEEPKFDPYTGKPLKPETKKK